MTDGGIQLGTAGTDRAQSLAVGWVEVSGETGDSSGDLAHRRPSREQRQRRERGRVDAA